MFVVTSSSSTPAEPLKNTTPATAEHLRGFSFPLNVYARLLELEDGHVEYMHYGLFERADGSAAEAQRRASALLWQHLPPPCRLLDVGVGLGTTLRRLTDAGYAVTGLTPDQAQVDFIHDRHGESMRVVCSSYEDFTQAEEARGQAGQWDAILFQESAQYIDYLDLLDCANRLLTEQGELIVMDEFFIKRDEHAEGHLHDLENFLRLAERFGFAVTTQLDVSAQAMPTVDWLLDAVARNTPRLIADLGVTEAQLETLNASNRRYQEQYRRGYYGYFLLRLQRQQRPVYLPGRIVGEQREAEMRALFAEVFGHPLSAEHWQWKYGAQRGQGIGIWRQSPESAPRLIAHYGGTSRAISLFGRPARAFQACDLMSASSERGSLTRKGPVFLAGATFLEHELGYAAPHLLGIGFPNKRAYRLPEKLGLYAEVLARIMEVSWPTAICRSWRDAVQELSPTAPEGDGVLDAAWAEMRTSLSELVVGVRDAAYVRQRYWNHPEHGYRLFAVRRRLSQRLLGVVVLRLIDGNAGEPPRCELLDVIGALPQVPALVWHARRLAAVLGAPTLFAWLADNLLPHFPVAEATAVNDLEVLVPGNNWTPGPPTETVKGRWWLTGGDTDFH